jgi:hypothetical protein
MPPAEIVLNGVSFSLGDSFTATFKLNESIARPFTAFAVIILPSGAMLNAITLDSSLKPVATGVSGLKVPFSYPLLSINIPFDAPKGTYELVVAFFDSAKPVTGRFDAFLDVSKTFTIQ